MNNAKKVRCHPALEELMRRQLTADEWEIDPTMDPSRVEVTPFAYAKNIQCEIGFVNDKEVKH